MESNLSNGVLTVKIIGELNSGNATEIEEELLAALEANSFQSLVLDFAELKYISSAGLRVVLKAKQRCADFAVINVSLDVYEVFDMTGFTAMMKIKKALKEVDVTGAELIGSGFFSNVYRIDKDTIIKVFKRATNTDDVERELNLAKQAFVLGIPTAISFDIVKVGNKYGVRFEMLDSKPLRDILRDDSEHWEENLQKYAELMKNIGQTESMSDALPDVKEAFLGKLDAVKDALDQAHYKKAKAFLESIPAATTFVHGDCHVKNIMVRENEFFLIDMDTLSRGHPVFEYALVYCPYCAFEEDDPGNSERFFGLPAETLHHIFVGVAKYYLGDRYSQEAMDQIALIGYIHMMWWTRQNEPENEKRFHGSKDRLIALLDKYPEMRFCA